MTKKDYKLIAESLRFSLQYTAANSPERVDGVLLAAKALAIDLRKDNPNFDVARFMEAVTKPIYGDNYRPLTSMRHKTD